jgi:hypothetical protein
VGFGVGRLQFCPEDVEVMRAKEEKHVVGKGILTLRIIKHNGIKAYGGNGGLSPHSIRFYTG